MLDTTPRSGTAAELLPPIYDTDAILADLPRQLEPWPNAQSSTKITTCLRRAQKYGGWAWPSKPVVFISDPHADAESFLRSLQAAGVIRRDFGAAGPISLTDFGKTCRIILGGDSLDKGPSNLAMLDALGQISSLEADLHILAGNHDLRMRMVVEALRGPRSALTDHLFVRMGRKILPALGEVFDHFVTAADMARLPDEVACRERLLPGPDWETRFAHAARDILRPKLLRQEIAKLKNRQAMLDQEIIRLGLSHRQILAAAWKCQEVFFQPGGAYAWFYDRMDVVTRAGSLLFVHAGLCDQMCETLVHQGAEAVNNQYRAAAEGAHFDFYFGPLANLVRTKYRDSDGRLTDHGVTLLHQAGIHMVVQGHVNNHKGQNLRSKCGLLHLEADITLDRVSRGLEGLEGIGAGATLIFPSGDVIGLSRDYPRAKHFAPDRIG